MTSDNLINEDNNMNKKNFGDAVNTFVTGVDAG